MNSLSQFSPPMTDAEQEATAAEFQARADVAFRMHGLRAPTLRTGEGLTEYRRRLLRNLAPKAGEPFSKINFTAMTRAALEPLEALMVDQAVAKFKEPTGPLRSMTERDASGRDVIRWYGDSAECWAPFRAPTRVWSAASQGQFVSSTRGANSPTAIRPVETLMSDGTVRRAG